MAELAAALHVEELDRNLSTWNRELDGASDSGEYSSGSGEAAAAPPPRRSGHGVENAKANPHERTWRRATTSRSHGANTVDKTITRRKLAAVSRWLADADLQRPPSVTSAPSETDAQPPAPVHVRPSASGALPAAAASRRPTATAMSQRPTQQGGTATGASPTVVAAAADAAAAGAQAGPPAAAPPDTLLAHVLQMMATGLAPRSGPLMGPAADAEAPAAGPPTAPPEPSLGWKRRELGTAWANWSAAGTGDADQGRATGADTAAAAGASGAGRTLSSGGGEAVAEQPRDSGPDATVAPPGGPPSAWYLPGMAWWQQYKHGGGGGAGARDREPDNADSAADVHAGGDAHLECRVRPRHVPDKRLSTRGGEAALSPQAAAVAFATEGASSSESTSSNGNGHPYGGLGGRSYGGSFVSTRSRRFSVSDLHAASDVKRPLVLRLRERAQVFHPLVVMDALLPILDPNSVPRRCWDLFIMAMVIWTAITVPLSVSYGFPTNSLWSGLGYAITLLFFVDLLVTFRTAFYNHQGELVRDSAAIAANYMKFWFWIDLFGTIPFDSIILWTGALDNQSDNTLAALGFLKAPRMLRLGRLLRFLDSFKNAKVFRIAQLFLAMILISHWLACIWYMMYRFGGKNHAEVWAFSRVQVDQEEMGMGMGVMATTYLLNYYYCFLLLVGENVPAFNNYERTFYCIVEVLGVFFYSAIVGQMSTMVASMNAIVSRQGQRCSMTLDTMHYMGAPDEKREQVQTYFSYIQARSHPGAEGMAFLRELPAPMFRELHCHMYEGVLAKVPLFADMEPGFLRALATRVQLSSLHPAEPVFRVGEAGHQMYFIRKGHVAVTSGNGDLCALLQPGEAFGEVALLSTGKRTANCTALGFVDLAVLTGNDLQVVMSDFPLSRAKVRQRAADRVRELAVTRKMWLDDEVDGKLSSPLLKRRAPRRGSADLAAGEAGAAELAELLAPEPLTAVEAAAPAAPSVPAQHAEASAEEPLQQQRPSEEHQQHGQKPPPEDDAHAAARPSAESLRGASRVYWRAIEGYAHPTDVLHLTPRGEEGGVQAARDGAGTGAAAAHAAAAAGQESGGGAAPSEASQHQGVSVALGSTLYAATGPPSSSRPASSRQQEHAPGRGSPPGPLAEALESVSAPTYAGIADLRLARIARQPLSGGGASDALQGLLSHAVLASPMRGRTASERRSSNGVTATGLLHELAPELTHAGADGVTATGAVGRTTASSIPGPPSSALPSPAPAADQRLSSRRTSGIARKVSQNLAAWYAEQLDLYARDVAEQDGVAPAAAAAAVAAAAASPRRRRSTLLSVASGSTRVTEGAPGPAAAAAGRTGGGFAGASGGGASAAGGLALVLEDEGLASSAKLPASTHGRPSWSVPAQHARPPAGESQALQLGGNTSRRASRQHADPAFAPPPPPPPPPPPVYTYVPVCRGGAEVQALADGGFYVSEARWRQILGSLHCTEGALASLASHMAVVEAGMQRLEAAALDGGDGLDDLQSPGFLAVSQPAVTLDQLTWGVAAVVPLGGKRGTPDAAAATGVAPPQLETGASLRRVQHEEATLPLPGTADAAAMLGSPPSRGVTAQRRRLSTDARPSTGRAVTAAPAGAAAERESASPEAYTVDGAGSEPGALLGLATPSSVAAARLRTAGSAISGSLAARAVAAAPGRRAPYLSADGRAPTAGEPANSAAAGGGARPGTGRFSLDPGSLRTAAAAATVNDRGLRSPRTGSLGAAGAGAAWPAGWAAMPPGEGPDGTARRDSGGVVVGGGASSSGVWRGSVTSATGIPSWDRLNSGTRRSGGVRASGDSSTARFLRSAVRRQEGG